MTIEVIKARTMYYEDVSYREKKIHQDVNI